MRLDVVLNACTEAVGLPTRVQERDGFGYAIWEDDAHAQVVVVHSGGRGRGGMGRPGLPTLHVTWTMPGGWGNGMFAPQDYDYLPWLARDLARVLRDGPDATISLGHRYTSEEDHRVQVERVREHRARVAELLGDDE